jgi:hypothetical protein
MDQTSVKIAQFILDSKLEGSNHGLMHGGTGISIFFNHLARKTNNADYEQFASDLLDNAFANLSTLFPTDFENGLAGIGWGIEYLVQNNFAEGDADEILEVIDNKVFRLLNEELLASFELTNGLTGYLFYLIYRLKNKTASLSMVHRINRELLILTINKIDEQVTTQFPLIVKDIYFDMMWKFPVMLSGLSEAFTLNIYNEKIVCIIKQLLPNFEAYLPAMQINRIYMATILQQIFNQIPDPRLEKQIKILLFSTDFNTLKTEIDPDQMNLRFGWPGVVIILHKAIQKIPAGYPNHSKLKSVYQYIINKYNNTLFNLQSPALTPNTRNLGISEGISGIGLFCMFMSGIFQKNPRI